MDLASAKMIGAGLAVIALAGVGAGIGNIFANTSGRGRPQPGDPRHRVPDHLPGLRAHARRSRYSRS